jgi:hypothetical protein
MGQLILQFCGFDSTIAKIITWGTQGEFELGGKKIYIGHVDVVTDLGLLGAQHQDGLGGRPSGVWVRPFDYLSSCGGINPVRVAIDCSDEGYLAAMAFAEAQVGKPYDTVDMLQNFLLERDWRDPNAWFCSELAIETVNHAKVFRFPLAAECNRVAPSLAYAVVSTYGRVYAVAANDALAAGLAAT